MVDHPAFTPQNGYVALSQPVQSPRHSFFEVYMPAYLLLVLAILTRVVPHHGWLNFTAVGGALLYFGARRSWREMLAPLAALMVTDYCLTVFAYHYSFAWSAYVNTWAWYLRSE